MGHGRGDIFIRVLKIMYMGLLLLSLSLHAEDSEPPHLNPYLDGIREEEVVPWKDEILSNSPDVEGAESAQTALRMRFVSAQLGYMLGFGRARNQLAAAGEFGFRKYRSDENGWGFGPRIGVHALDGENAVYVGVTGQMLTGIGLWSAGIGGGYRRSQFRPHLVAAWRLWTPSSQPMSQWTISPEFDIDFGKGGASWGIGFLIGQDWQW